MQINRYFNTFTVGDTDEVFALLGLRSSVGYEIRQIVTTFGRDAALTDDTSWQLVSAYSQQLRGSNFNIRAGLMTHEWVFRSRAATGVEWQPQSRTLVWDVPPGLVIPQLLCRVFMDGAAVSFRWNVTLAFDQVKMGTGEYVALNQKWDVDVNEPIIPVRFRATP